MNCKIICGIVFVFFCVLQLGYAIKCYRCTSEDTCRNAKTYECNQLYANETSRYLDAYYLNVNTNLTSPNYVCFRQDMKHTSGKIKYKGCLYSNINACALTLRPFYQQGMGTWSCNTCYDKNGCNPAGRMTVSTAAITLPLVFAFIYKMFV